MSSRSGTHSSSTPFSFDSSALAPPPLLNASNPNHRRRPAGPLGSGLPSNPPGGLAPQSLPPSWDAGVTGTTAAFDSRGEFQNDICSFLSSLPGSSGTGNPSLPSPNYPYNYSQIMGVSPGGLEGIPEDHEGFQVRTSGSEDEGRRDSDGSPTTNVRRNRGTVQIKDQEKEGEKKRRRKPSSCEPCRKRKLRCNRVYPCGACTSRGQGDSCTWIDATPLYAARDMDDRDELRAQVEKLRGLVDTLVNPSTLQLQREAAAPFGGGRVQTGQGFGISLLPQEEIDLRATDVCQALSQLTFSSIEQTTLAQDDPGQSRLVDEARAVCTSLPQNFGLTPSLPFERPIPSGSKSNAGLTSTTQMSRSLVQLSRLPYAGQHGSLQEALGRRPSQAQADNALKFYFTSIDWHLHPLHTPTFDGHLQLMRQTLVANPAQVDPFFFSLFMAICGVGLAMMPDQRAIQDGFPIGIERTRLVDSWLEASMNALAAGRFLEDPNIEALRALIVLNGYFVFMAPGEGAGSGITVLSLGVQLAQQLGLNRDPDNTPGKYNRLEAEDRRRVFWTLFHLLTLSSSSLGRSWMVFDVNNIDTRLPLDADDHEILAVGNSAQVVPARETIMTHLIVKMRIAQVAAGITSRAFGLRPVTYSTILDLDREVQSLEESLPPFYRLKFADPNFHALIQESTIEATTITERRAFMIHISIAQEYIRIHRPFLVKGLNNPKYSRSRTRCLKHANILLAISRVPEMRQAWSGVNSELVAAATVLGIELLQNPDNNENNQIRQHLKVAAAQLEGISNVSSIGRKGSKLIKFLLQKDVARSRGKQHAPRAKRTKVNENQSDIPPLKEAFSLESTSSTSTIRDQRGLPHKTPQKMSSPQIIPGYSSSASFPLPDDIHGRQGSGSSGTYPPNSETRSRSSSPLFNMPPTWFGPHGEPNTPNFQQLWESPESNTSGSGERRGPIYPGFTSPIGPGGYPTMSSPTTTRPSSYPYPPRTSDLERQVPPSYPSASSFVSPFDKYFQPDSSSSGFDLYNNEFQQDSSIGSFLQPSSFATAPHQQQQHTERSSFPQFQSQFQFE